MKCQKIVSLLLSVCMLLCLAACQKDTEQPQEPENEEIIETEPDNESEEITENQPDTEITEDPVVNDTESVKILSLEKSLHTYYEWDDTSGKDMVRSEHSYVTVGQEDAELYPEMAETFNQIAAMQTRSMEDEFDNLLSIAREELDANSDGFETCVSTLDVQVRRGDSVVISLLTDSYSHYGQIENYRVFHGSNYDTQSGEELTLDDVVKSVNNDLALAVEKELNDHTWTADFYSEYAVQDYFANTPYDGFNWTIDYIGLTFYFSAGDLSDDGLTSATLAFAEYPELFNEKYMVAPAEYAIELPLDISFFAELDTDDDLEAISVSGWYNDERNHFMDYGIYTDTDGQYYYEECYVYDLHPYYVKAADGNYVYLFCEDFEEGWRQMSLVVLSLNADGSVTKVGEMNVSPSWLADNKFIVPTDPGKLILDDVDNGTEKIEFTVGNNGMPSK